MTPGALELLTLLRMSRYGIPTSRCDKRFKKELISLGYAKLDPVMWMREKADHADQRTLLSATETGLAFLQENL